MSYYILPKINTFFNIIPEEEDLNECQLYISFSSFNPIISKYLNGIPLF